MALLTAHDLIKIVEGVHTESEASEYLKRNNIPFAEGCVFTLEAFTQSLMARKTEITMSLSQVSDAVGLCRQTIMKYAKTGLFPYPKNYKPELNPGKYIYHKAVIDDWIKTPWTTFDSVKNDRLLTTKQVLDMLELSRPTLNKLRDSGRFPMPEENTKPKKYSENKVQEWIKNKDYYLKKAA